MQDAAQQPLKAGAQRAAAHQSKCPALHVTAHAMRVRQPPRARSTVAGGEFVIELCGVHVEMGSMHRIRQYAQSCSQCTHLYTSWIPGGSQAYTAHFETVLQTDLLAHHPCTDTSQLAKRLRQPT